MLRQPKHIILIAILPGVVDMGSTGFIEKLVQLISQVLTKLAVSHEAALFKQLVAGGIVRKLVERSTTLP